MLEMTMLYYNFRLMMKPYIMLRCIIVRYVILLRKTRDLPLSSELQSVLVSASTSASLHGFSLSWGTKG